jgi:hypothetical protein
MGGCILRFINNSPLRTTLVDEVTGQIKYKIETPMRIARSITRIRKFESPVEPPLHLDEDADSDSGDDICEKEGRDQELDSREEGPSGGIETELPETSGEIGRIYWKWFSSNRIIFRGRITNRGEFLPKCGKLKG